MTLPLWSQVPVGTAIDNVARYSYHTLGGVARLATSDTTHTVVSAGSFLNIEKTAESAVVTPGDSLTYTIMLYNSGNQAKGVITLRDPLEP